MRLLLREHTPCGKLFEVTTTCRYSERHSNDGMDMITYTRP